MSRAVPRCERNRKFRRRHFWRWSEVEFRIGDQTWFASTMARINTLAEQIAIVHANGIEPPPKAIADLMADAGAVYLGPSPR